jgi:hypothetical protein
MDDDSTGTDEWKHAVSESDKRDTLHSFLADRDEPCPNCGYNLRGLATDVCPECRQDLVLGVRVREPRHGPYVTAVVGLACGAGFHVFLSVIMLVDQLSRQGVQAASKLAYLALVDVLQICVLLLFIRFRKHMAKWNARTRLSVAAAAWLVTICSVIITYFVFK